MDKTCFSCGQMGHLSKNCPLDKFDQKKGPVIPGKNDKCFNCGDYGHWSKECPKAEVKCYNCGEYGHISRDCNNERQPNVIPKKCFNCGELGHISSACPQ